MQFEALVHFLPNATLPALSLTHAPLVVLRSPQNKQHHTTTQLLSYLAQVVLANPCESPRDTIETLRREALPRSVDRRQQHGGQTTAMASTKATLPEDTEMEEENDIDVVTPFSPAVHASDGRRLTAIAALNIPEIGVDSTGGVVGRGQQNGDIANNVSGAGNPGYEQGHIVSVVNGTGSDEAVQGEGGSFSAVVVADVSREQHLDIEPSLRQGSTGANKFGCEIPFPTRKELSFADVPSSPTSETGGNAAVTRGALSPETNCASYAGQSPSTGLDGEGGFKSAEGIATSGEAAGSIEPDDQLRPPPPPPPAYFPPPCYSGTTGLDPSNPYSTIRCGVICTPPSSRHVMRRCTHHVWLDLGLSPS